MSLRHGFFFLPLQLPSFHHQVSIKVTQLDQAYLAHPNRQRTASRMAMTKTTLSS